LDDFEVQEQKPFKCFITWKSDHACWFW